MSLFMAYFLFWMMFIHKQECAVIRLDHPNRNAFEYVIQKYMNPLRRLSADLPNHAIEMEIEIHGSVPRVVKNDPRRFIRLISPRHPKPILRSQDGAEGDEAPSVPDAAATAPVAPDAGQATATPAAPPAAPAAPPAAPAPAGADPDTQKIPVFMEDLKKALDELEKKLIVSSDNAATVATSGNTPNSGAAAAFQNLNAPVAAPQAPSQPVRSIDEIVQLLKKAIHIENRMPKAGDEKLEWVQIKIPKTMQL